MGKDDQVGEALKYSRNDCQSPVSLLYHMLVLESFGKETASDMNCCEGGNIQGLHSTLKNAYIGI